MPWKIISRYFLAPYFFLSLLLLELFLVKIQTRRYEKSQFTRFIVYLDIRNLSSAFGLNRPFNLRLATLSIVTIIYLPNTNWYGNFGWFWWNLELVEKYTATKIPLQDSSLYKYLLCSSKIWIKLPITWRIRSVIKFFYGLPVVAGLETIPFCSSTKAF